MNSTLSLGFQMSMRQLNVILRLLKMTFFSNSFFRKIIHIFLGCNFPLRYCQHYHNFQVLCLPEMCILEDFFRIIFESYFVRFSIPQEFKIFCICVFLHLSTSDKIKIILTFENMTNVFPLDSL